MIIKVWNYLNELNNEKVEISKSIDKVLNSGSLILGSSVRNFEAEFAKYCDSKYGVGVNSGTDALFLGLKALGIGKGDEVITVPNTAVPTVSAIVSAGAKPVFIDVDLNTYLMDTNKLEGLITKRTKCIIPVHLYGQCVDMSSILKIAKKHKLKVLEDCAQAHGALFKGKKAGSMSDVSAFSFYPTKILGGYGDGGMVITNKKRIEKKLRRLRFYGMDDKYYSEEHGYNSRLDELHAEILLQKLRHLDKYITRRQYLAEKYDLMLKDTDLIIPEVMDGNKHAYYLYVVRHTKRNSIIKELKKKNIIVNVSYPYPIHTMRGYKFLGYKKGDFPITEKLSKEIFSLPLYPSLKDKELKTVVKELIGILKKV